MIKLKSLNGINLKVRDYDASFRWYHDHFGFERRYDVEGGVVVGVGDIEIILSPHLDPDAPLADPRTVRCIHTLGFSVTKEEYLKARKEFADDPDLVEFDQAEFASFITADPDDYCVEISYNK